MSTTTATAPVTSRAHKSRSCFSRRFSGWCCRVPSRICLVSGWCSSSARDCRWRWPARGSCSFDPDLPEVAQGF